MMFSAGCLLKPSVGGLRQRKRSTSATENQNQTVSSFRFLLPFLIGELLWIGLNVCLDEPVNLSFLILFVLS